MIETAIKTGFKQTELGLIPSDWEVNELGKLTTLLTNGFVGKSKEHYVDSNDGVLYIQGYNVEENSFNFSGIKRVSQEFHKLHSKSFLLEGDLLTIQTGEIGLTTIVPKELEGSNCHALIISRFIKGKFEPKYFSYYFNSNYGRKRLRDIEIGTTMKHLNVSDMRLWLVPYPPSKKEQTLIATALSDADAFITSLEKLIAKKRMIKQGAMQKLLAPKKGWVVKKLGEICQIFKGRSLSKSMLNENGKYECVLYGELFTTYKEVINEVVSHTNLLEGVPSKFGDILFPGSTTTTGIDLAKASALMKENVQLGGDVIIVRKKDFEYNPIFLSYFLNQERKQEIASTTKGITIHHLYGKDLFDIEVSFPQDKEQNHIATILGDMDLEIVGLEKKLEKQRMIKAGMMQQLLTGKIRIYGNN